MDMDDTLLAPWPHSPLARFKRDWGLPADQTVITSMPTLPQDRQRAALEAFRLLELDVAYRSRLREGMPTFMRSLRISGVHLGLVTNNSRKATDIVLKRHKLYFSLVLTRDDGPPKPSPALLLLALSTLSLTSEQAVYIGDTSVDQQAAHAAGIACYLLHTPRNEALGPSLPTPQSLLALLQETVVYHNGVAEGRDS